MLNFKLDRVLVLLWMVSPQPTFITIINNSSYLAELRLLKKVKWRYIFYFPMILVF